MIRGLVAGAAAALLVGSVWFGQAPPRSPGAYEARAVQTATYLRSQVRTAGLWIQAVEDGRATHQAATVALDEAETDAINTAGRFAAWDPPAGAELLRREVTGAATAATDTLASLRILANQGRWAAVAEAAAALTPTEDRLDRLLSSLERDQR